LSFAKGQARGFSPSRREKEVFASKLGRDVSRQIEAVAGLALLQQAIQRDEMAFGNVLQAAAGATEGDAQGMPAQR
jgi:hypothetical protein